MENEPNYSYSNEDAINDGYFADVTPNSIKEKGQMRWVVTSKVYKNFSLAAIANMYNELAAKINAAGGMENVEYPVITKMNAEDLWMFLESEGGKLVFKIIYPDEY